MPTKKPKATTKAAPKGASKADASSLLLKRSKAKADLVQLRVALRQAAGAEDYAEAAKVAAAIQKAEAAKAKAETSIGKLTA